MIVEQNKEIAWQVYDGEAVLVDPEGSVCRVLNDTATFIWNMCENPCSIEQIIGAVQNEYDSEIMYSDRGKRT